jgi:hypothetical protein
MATNAKTTFEFEVKILRVFEHFVPDTPPWSFGWFIELELIDECLRLGNEKPADLKAGDTMIVHICPKK